MDIMYFRLVRTKHEQVGNLIIIIAIESKIRSIVRINELKKIYILP
jgi:hypothetical protein